jgi:hypothetical protein
MGCVLGVPRPVLYCSSSLRCSSVGDGQVDGLQLTGLGIGDPPIMPRLTAADDGGLTAIGITRAGAGPVTATYARAVARDNRDVEAGHER